MSLLFEKAIGKFDLSSAALHSPADETFEPVRDDPIQSMGSSNMRATTTNSHIPRKTAGS